MARTGFDREARYPRPKRAIVASIHTALAPGSLPWPQAQLPPTIVAVLSYVVMAGFFTQSGVILAPAAAYFGLSITATASIFSYLVGGNLIGIIASMFAFRAVSIKGTFAVAYGVLFAGIAVLLATHAFPIACFALACVGFGGGLGLSAGAVIISKTFAANRRAVAFLATDCAFSIAGFVFPVIAGVAIARGYRWSSGYLAAGAIAMLMLAGMRWITFPRVLPDRAVKRSAPPTLQRGAMSRIALYGVGLALYLCGQSVFLLWAPSYLHVVFGVPALQAGGVVSSFWGPSVFGLIVAALLTARIQPRRVLVGATSIAVFCLALLATTANVAAFFAVTLGFGFSSTCMYKLMISIGSEQIATAPPLLVTFLLLSGSIGGTIAPVVSANVVHALGPHAGPFMTLGCYATALLAVLAALALERAAREHRPAPAVAG